MKIAIDFDGVLCDLKGIKRPWKFSSSKPKEDASDAVKWLLEEGHDIWMFTCRTKEEWGMIREWCDKHDIPQLPITNTKHNATIYLDDRAVRFTNWQDFCKLIK